MTTKPEIQPDKPEVLPCPFCGERPHELTTMYACDCGACATKKQWNHRAHAPEKERGFSVVCPFCNEGDFDLIGLKLHLIRWCEKYDYTPVRDELIHAAEKEQK